MPTIHDAELLAAILAAGMLPKVRALTDPENVANEDAQRIIMAVGHAVSLYAAVLEGLRSRTEKGGPRRTRRKETREPF
jgi:hypothetical protein